MPVDAHILRTMLHAYSMQRTSPDPRWRRLWRRCQMALGW